MSITPRVVDEPRDSNRISIVAGFFGFTAGVGGTALVLSAGIGAYRSAEMRALLLAHPGGFLLALLSVAGYGLAGYLLMHRRRAGAWVALAALTPGIFRAATGAAPWLSIGTIISVLGIAAIVSAWKELE